MQLSDAIAIIQTTLAICAFIFTVRELRQWRIELLGSKKIELALRLGKAVIGVREGFKHARNPFTFARSNTQNQSDEVLNKEDQRRQDREYEFDQRLEMVHSKLLELYDIRWEVSVLFGRKGDFEEEIKAYNKKFAELRNAMIAIYMRQATEKDYATLYAGFDQKDDEFGKAINEITDRFLLFVQRYTQ